MSKSSKYLLCRTKGGLNDTLCQIERCWRYAELYGRRLVVDTAQSGLLDDIFQYLELRENATVQVDALSPKLLATLNRVASVFPPTMRSRISANAHDDTSYNSGAVSSLDYTRDYDEQLIIPYQHEGGRLGVFCLERLRFRKHIAVRILNRIPELGTGYCGIHIRDTDLKTDYPAFFSAIKCCIKGENVLVCSDNAACIDYARQYFSGVANIHSNPNIPDNKGIPLHHDRSLNRFETNIDTFADLFWLSMSKKLFVMGTTTIGLSGFTRLAVMLATRKRIAGNLVSSVGGPIDQDSGDLVTPTNRRRPTNDPIQTGHRFGVSVWRVRKASLFSRSMHFVHPYLI
jgi:hypothetical protein